MTVSPSPEGATWSFNRVGPFYLLQRRLRLLSDTDLAAAKRALLFAAFAALPALALGALQGVLLDPKPERALLKDFGTYAVVIAIAAFVLMEQTSDARMKQLVQNFSVHGLVPPQSLPGFRQARLRMERLTGLAWVEALLLVAAYVLGYEWLWQMAHHSEGGTWAGQVVNGEMRYTLAGLWAQAVTLPLFLFLLGRWLWRFVTWGLMLRDVAACEMNLVATHADRCGGLAFIGQYPNTYVLFVFSVSLVVSGGVLRQVVHADVNPLAFKYAALCLMVGLLLAFVAPLLAFMPTLSRLKRDGLQRYGALISRHNLAFQRKWCGDTQPLGEELLGQPDVSSLADLSMSYEMVKRMLPVPIGKASIVPLVLAMLLPMMVVAATAVPIKQVLEGLKGMLVL